MVEIKILILFRVVEVVGNRRLLVLLVGVDGSISMEDYLEIFIKSVNV